MAAKQEKKAQPTETQTQSAPRKVASKNVALAASEKAGIVIGAWPGTEDLMRSVWGKMIPSGKLFRVITIQEGKSLQDELAELVAEESVADEFVYAAPNLIPCSKLSMEDLRMSLAYVFADGKTDFTTPLPGLYVKDALINLFASVQGKDDNEFLAAYAARFRSRPVAAGFTFGNIVTPVNRGDPCENRVIEAMLRKKFITANAVGFAAIASLVKKLIDE